MRDAERKASLFGVHEPGGERVLHAVRGCRRVVAVTGKGVKPGTLGEQIAAAEAQQIQRQTLSELYVQFLAVDKWDGKMPQVTGTGGTPFIQIPTR